jgi:hypothetical protein
MKHKKSFRGLTSLIFFLFIFSAYANSGQYSDKINGIVLYSDDLTPVRGGTIEIVSTSTPAIGDIVLERVTINADGTFKISKKSLIQKDNIKIMAYPNDVDGKDPDFKSSEFLPAEVIVQTKEDMTLVIKVERVSYNKEEKSDKTEY